MNNNDADSCAKDVFQHWDLLERLARQRFRDSSLTEESINFVLAKVTENECARLKKYQGRSSFRTYLAHVVHNLLTDFYYHKFGKCRAPAWVKASGCLFVRVYEKLCCQRMSRAEVAESLSTANPGASETRIQEAITVIKSRIKDCGKLGGFAKETPLSDEVADTMVTSMLGDDAALEADPEQHLLAQQRAQVMQAVLQALTCGESDKAPENGEAVLSDAILRLRDKLCISAEERLLLKLVYLEDMKVAVAGQFLNMGVHQVHGRLRRLLRRIREAMDQEGLYDVLRLVLETDAQSKKSSDWHGAGLVR
jgi:RNA polymerase sigma factor (sigma-70 family)